ncbi:MAG: DJ-1/PfpI family protein [Dehalococcoidia bacterium]
MTKNIAFILFNDAEELDFVGPWEVLTSMRHVDEDAARCYTVSEHGGTVTCAKGLRVLADYSFADAPKPDIFIVPGGMGTRTEVDNPAFMAYIGEVAKSAEISTSVCTGALVLERAGLLKGKKATTWWGMRPHLGEKDGVEVVEERWVDEGDVITAAGVSAGIDMALHLVGRLWGPEKARLVQKYIEYYPAPPYAEVPVPA